MPQLLGDDSSQTAEELYVRSRQAPKRRITVESVAWGIGLAVVAYMLLAAVAGIPYAG